jgi:large subunit ribosomal protein L13
MVWLAVKGMLPKSRLGRKQIKDLKLFKGETHEHHAQKPVAYAIVGRRR